MTHPLLELQAADTLADQLRHRRSHLPEAEQVAAAKAALREWEGRHDTLRKRIADLEAAIERSEAHSHDIDTQRARLEKQMKTVIAPREAEALMHEIALLNERRGELDDAELAALEEQSQIDDDLHAIAGEEAPLRDAVAAAEATAARAAQQIDADLADIAERLAALRSAVDPALLARYDEARKHQMVAAAQLMAHRCSGCHLDLSAGETDIVKDEAKANAGVGVCPACNRLLIVA